MNRKRISLDGQSKKIFDKKNSFENKENLFLASNLSEKIFKTPEKKQITIENSTTTVTITNYFHQCKYSFQRENFPKNDIDFKGLEKKLNFEESIKDQKIIIKEKRNHLSSSSDKKPHLSITFSELRRNGYNFGNKRFSSSKIKSKSINSRVKNSKVRSNLNLSSNSLSLNECIKEKKVNSSDQDTEGSIDSDICLNYTIPFNRVNDESYKIKALRKLRKPEISNNKSVNCKFYEYKRRPFDYGLYFLN